MSRTTPPSRREFMRTSGALATGTWLTLNLQACERMSEQAREAAARGDAFTTLTEEEGRVLDALASLIIPSDDDVPGAHEAGAVYFMDIALAGPEASSLEFLRTGLASLAERVGERGSFADLSHERQSAMLTAVVEEDPDFFGYVRYLTLCGTFSTPDRGGNRNGAGWQIAQMDVQPTYQPPFGYYDAEVHGTAAGGGSGAAGGGAGGAKDTGSRSTGADR